MLLSPTTSGQTSLIPVNDCVLVKLDRTDKREGKYDTRTSGILINISESFSIPGGTKTAKLINKRVYFEEYKEGARIKRDGELFCFIKLEDVRGYEDV